jgi:hypothetical protein
MDHKFSFKTSHVMFKYRKLKLGPLPMCKYVVNVLYSVNKRAHEGQLDWATCLVNTMRSTVRVLTQLIYGSCGQGRVSRVYPMRMGHEMTLP